MTATLTRQLECTVDPAAFKTAVGAAAKRISARPALPLLACIRLDLNGDRLTVQAFDYEVSLTAVVTVDGRHDGSALVSGRLLSALADTLPAKPVHLVMDADRLKLTCGTVKLGFPTMPVHDYPALPSLPPEVGTVDAAVLARAVKRVAVATGPDATPVFLTAMWLGFGDMLTFAASDRYRVAGVTVPWQTTGTDAEGAVVLAHQLAEIAPMFSGPVTVHADDNLFGLSSAGLTVVAAQFGTADHPRDKILSFLAPTAGRTVAVDGAEFVEHLTRANKVHEKETPIILTIDGGTLTVTATGGDTADAAASMPCELDGEPVEVHVNPTYLIDAVKAVGTTQVQLVIVHPNKGFQVLPVGDDPYRHVVVPIRNLSAR